MAKVVLEKLVKQAHPETPEFYKNLDCETFGIDWKLHQYQQDALRHSLNTLYYYFNQFDALKEHYRSNVNEQWGTEIAYRSDNENFDLLRQYYEAEDGQISYEQFLNRASLWMATGSGKTLVLIKLIEFLYLLATNGHIPKNDMVILAPKPEILAQIKEHIELFNKSGGVTINLRDLREFEKQKHLQTSLYDTNAVTVFYYRSDNITDTDKTELLSYQTVLNGGKWYVLLDEAHKGEKQDSIRQAYYSILAHKGFIFNFSATFTDTVDIVTTAFNFNLKKFIESGYGKHITISGEEFKNWKKTEGEFSEAEKTAMVVKSLLVITAIKKKADVIKKYNPELYHNPLLITIANEVNTVDAELKLFFQQLALIASGNYNIRSSIDALKADLLRHKEYQFDTAIIPSWFVQTVNDITKEDILHHVFNASAHGKIEYTRISNNSREVAFRLKTSETGKHFCLLVASDATKWSENILDDYEYTETPLTRSYFKSINDQDSGINILLGSRIFSEGWDSNRPNVVNFINIGVSDDAQKFVLQAIGRGVRIQPVPGIRKRLDHISGPTESETLKKYIQPTEKAAILKECLPLESLFIFSTKKEVIKNITENLNRERDADDWKVITGVQKTKIDRDLLIPKYQTVDAEIPAYAMAQSEYKEVLAFVGETNSPLDKIMLMRSPDNVSKTIISTLTKIRDTNNFDLTSTSKRSGRTPMDNLLLLNRHFHQRPKKLLEYQPTVNEINHFDKFEVANLPDSELATLEAAIVEALSRPEQLYGTEEEIFAAYKADKITSDQLKEQLSLFSKTGADEYTFNDYSLKINTDFLAEHYYNPILLTSEAHKHLFKHIIWVRSEIEFLTQLQANRALLDKYEWWYFSKIDQTTDDVSIPYYDTKEQEYRNFFPDFIFWLKEKDSDKYLIKFIDPKGNEQGVGNAEDKTKGFEATFVGQQMKYGDTEVSVELYYYNDSLGVPASVAGYFTKDFNVMFASE